MLISVLNTMQYNCFPEFHQNKSKREKRTDQTTLLRRCMWIFLVEKTPQINSFNIYWLTGSEKLTRPDLLSFLFFSLFENGGGFDPVDKIVAQVVQTQNETRKGLGQFDHQQEQGRR